MIWHERCNKSGVTKAMRKIFLDIETLPPDRETVVSPQSLETCADEDYKKLALKAEKGRILTVGVIVEENNLVVHQGLFGRDRQTGMFHLDEARTLRGFWNFVGEVVEGRDLFIGHNILDFDLPFLIKRSIVHRVKPAKISFARFRQSPIFDTMWEWSLWRERISLNQVAEAIGIASPKNGGIDGSQIYDYFCAGKHGEIAEYCMRDVECTREVYYCISFLDAPLLKPYQVEQRAVSVEPTAAGLALAV